MSLFIPKKKNIFGQPKLNIRIVEPHKEVSAWAGTNDLKRILDEGAQMITAMDRIEKTTKTVIYALSHAQVTNKKPLRFFMLNPHNPLIRDMLRSYSMTSTIFINPKITNHTKVPVPSEEGCVTFLDCKNTVVQRFHKIEVTYATLKPLPFGDPEWVTVENFSCSSLFARIFAHEIDHMDARYIFPYNGN